MSKSKSRRPWLIPALVALILFLGGVAGNLVANDLQQIIGPYRPLVWALCAMALIVAVVTAIVDTHRGEHSSTAEKIRSVNAPAERSVAAEEIKDSTIVTGDENVVNSKAGRDIVIRDKITYNSPPATSAINFLHQLRAPVGDFVGRKHEIETLIDALRRGNHAVINGMGGIGKTELALLVAERVAGNYPDAQFFINLQGAGANPRPPEEVLAMCIRAFLGPEAALPEDLDQLSQYYRSQLSGKRVLLLLDNAADSGQVQPLLPPPGSVVLATSRQAVAGMTRVKLNPLTEVEAQQLLLEIAPHAKAAAAQICELCGYLPLAIRAAGSLLEVTDDLDPVAYATQLEDERSRLERIGKEGVEIDVAASFNLSYERLTPEAARVFRLLAVFPGTFDALAEEAICGDSDHAQLSDLLRRSLVLYDPDTKRYSLHDLARLFADSKLSIPEHAMGQKYFAMHYENVLERASQLYEKGGESLHVGLALLDREWRNIQEGHTWVAAQADTADEDVALLRIRYPNIGGIVLELRQHPREQIRWLEIALTTTQVLTQRVGEGCTLGNLGIAYARLGDNSQAIQLFEQALVIQREVGDRRGEGQVLGNLGSVYVNLGKNREALKCFEQCLNIARELGDRRREGTVLNNLGGAYRNLGEFRQSIQFYDQALLIHREIGDRRGEGAALANLGNVYFNLGETNRAIEFYEQGMVIYREIGDRQGEGIALSNMSLALDRLGERAEAIRSAEQSLIIYEQIEDPDAAKVRAQLAKWREETRSD